MSTDWLMIVLPLVPYGATVWYINHRWKKMYREDTRKLVEAASRHIVSRALMMRWVREHPCDICGKPYDGDTDDSATARVERATGHIIITHPFCMPPNPFDAEPLRD
jgi:hypothetical protein